MNNWPPDYTQVFMERQNRYLKVKDNKDLVYGAKSYYSNNYAEFINDWGTTYDPRNAGLDKPVLLPFIIFPRQVEFIQFLKCCLDNQTHGMIEKSRDMGATWAACWFSLCLWLFSPGCSIGWGSRKEQLVDKLGDPDSIFQKLRMGLDYLPRWLWPIGFDPKIHSTYMKLINPETGATITGEAGDNIGRGGRKLIYFKDESAHYEHPESIEAALGDNTNVQIDISSVAGTNNIFYRRRQTGELWEPGKSITPNKTQVFVMDWRSHPLKTQVWYNARRAKAEEEGLLHLFAQEVDHDYTSSIEGVVIPAAWVRAAIDSHKKLGIEITGIVDSALDVADEGKDKSCLAIKKGILLQYIEAWAKGDVGETANKALNICKLYSAKNIFYDCIGVGAGIKAETNRLNRENLLGDINVIPWNAAGAVLSPDKPIYKEELGQEPAPLNKDFFCNLKAQGWWNLRDRFHKTYKAVTQGIQYNTEDLISISSDINSLQETLTELSQPTYTAKNGKILINKKPDGGSSPNRADAIMMVYWPINIDIPAACSIKDPEQEYSIFSDNNNRTNNLFDNRRARA